jgi:hypothetical protein
VGRNILILPSTDSGLRHSTVSTVLELLDQIAKTAAQHASGRRAAENAAQSSWDEIAQTTTGLGATRIGATGYATRYAAWLAAKQTTQNIAEPSARIAGGYSAPGGRGLGTPVLPGAAG